ncbi:cytochrome c oxidase subunit 6C [Hermetia illucens]|nr:cytochrome c oxidase subunit 6C [Hermetia illucens]
MSSSVAETKSIPKPVLRGLHNATIKRNLIVALGLVVTITTAYKFAVNDVKKQKYAEFYKNYDAQKSFERMKKAGVLSAAQD